MAKDKQPKPPKDPSAPKKPRTPRLAFNDRIERLLKSREFHAKKVAGLCARIEALKAERRKAALDMLKEVGGLEQVEIPLASPATDADSPPVE